jgi:oligopeptide transport system ATP-binding protein
MSEKRNIKLQVNNLSVSFRTNTGKVKAVRDVSFELRTGETLAIVGESGSGKSVTAKAIMGILAPNSITENGSIIYYEKDGSITDMLKLKEEQFCKYRGNKIAMVFQDPLSSLNPIVRIGKQIMEVMTLNGVSKSEAKVRALDLMKKVGIPQPEKRFEQFPFEFSGGMRQRIVIAIAMASNPDVLICDEPTTALDVTIQAQILDLIHNLIKDTNMSCIFITHNLGVVANIADKVAVMYAGKIVEYGLVDEIFYEPKHPYTWALLASMPDLDTTEKLESIPGTPPNMELPPDGDAFAARNKYALEIDFEQHPPFFEVTPTHFAATWLMHPDSPKAEMPPIVADRIKRLNVGGVK